MRYRDYGEFMMTRNEALTTMPEDTEELLTVKQFAKRATLSETTIRRMIKHGYIKAVKAGPRLTRIPARELQEIFDITPEYLERIPR